MIRIPSSLRLLVGACALLAAAASSAAPFSGGNVTIVVGGPPGSSFDNAARLVAEPLSKEWGVPVVVENRPGASGMIAASQVARAAPDGRTILLTVTPTVQAPHLVRNPSYDPVASFAPLGQMFDARLWLAVNASVPAQTLPQFLQVARKPDARFSYASPGNGSTPHLNALLLTQQAKVDMLHVAYKGIPPAVMDTVSGQVTAVFASYSDVAPHARAGKLRILASTGRGRSELSPDVPSFREQGFNSLDFVGFGGLVVPAATPAPVVAEMAQALQQVMGRTDIKARLFALGFEPKSAGPEAFGKVIREQSAFWKKLIQDARLTAE
ncbi:tripartite tricarboxylate transporter substrate binding protein [Ramlibacter sp. AW1]|uniref:Tripartite tricarboxylate transporter substrate binding protein n=1 Tax=Ramlibacter aurantiacus TaxID=2801330 RepID=A0A936ZL21_9BURK|nr:tripartite tricarboxylate transporter substrate binding protein [Ramlibacter aurantiacus]MBL0419656.1 tripartite tricarboxylate transporter substrate binding protein [Ramlibacter aurantiacus]